MDRRTTLSLAVDAFSIHRCRYQHSCRDGALYFTTTCFSLIQVIRYNRLLGVIHQTLQDLLKALKGLVVMSQALETMANSLYNNAVPELWAAKVNSIDERAITWSAVPCMVFEYMTSCLMRC